MPWVATAGNGWKRNVESGVNGAEIAAVLQQKMHISIYLYTRIMYISIHFSSYLIDTIYISIYNIYKVDIF